MQLHYVLNCHNFLYIFYQTLPSFHFDLEKNETLVHFSIKAQNKSCYALPSLSQCEFEFHRKTGFSLPVYKEH